MEVCGVPSQEVLALSTRRQLFFDKEESPIIVPNSRGKERLPNSK
jgi:dual specificity tyrosine-phosphorylation-regulated kinase 2/3/4